MKPRLNQREYSGHAGSKMAEKGETLNFAVKKIDIKCLILNLEMYILVSFVCITRAPFLVIEYNYLLQCITE